MKCILPKLLGLILLVLCIYGDDAAIDLRTNASSQVPMARRGARAWDNAQRVHDPRWHWWCPLRLATHGVTDNTLNLYLAEVLCFLEWPGGRGLSHLSVRDLDFAMATRMDGMCHIECVGRHRASDMFYGFVHLYPELKGGMPLSPRSLVSWAKIRPGSEGGPVPEGAVCFAMKGTVEQGLIYDAWIVGISYDAYLRTQDWSQVRGADVYEHHMQVALVSGIAERGEASKTGHNQDVTLSRGWLAQVLVALAALVNPEDQVFPSTPE